MSEILVYLDSSAIVKRYTDERGTEGVDHLYRLAEQGRLVVGFSIWNIGETIGALDKYLTRGALNDDEFVEALRLLYGETEKLVRLNSLRIEQIEHGLLRQAWSLITKHHIYISDALQLSTAKNMRADAFLSADKLLLEKARDEGILGYDIENETEKVLKITDTTS